MEKQPFHISIQETRLWDSYLVHLVIKRTAHVYRGDRNSSSYKHRMYECSEASILRLAKIQEKLAG